MERMSGAPLTDLASIRAVTNADPEGVLIGALNVWFASVLGADTFHADVHAGAWRRMSSRRSYRCDKVVASVSMMLCRGYCCLWFLCCCEGSCSCPGVDGGREISVYVKCFLSFCLL
jgi:hypothetical protein